MTTVIAKPVIPEKKEANPVPTVEEFSVVFMANYLPGQKPSERYGKLSALRSLLAHFGAKRLDEIIQLDVDAYTAVQLKTTEAKTLNNKLTVLSTLLGYASANRIPVSSGLRMHIDERSAEMHPVPDADVVKLLSVVTDARYRVAILLACEGGLRIGEIRGLQWNDVKDGWLTVRRAIDQRNNLGTPKHNVVRRVPVTHSLQLALLLLPKRGIWIITPIDGSGFLGYYGMLERLNAIYALAGVTVPMSESGKTMPWHALRHTFGTRMGRTAPIGVLRKLMGHTDIATTMRYVTTTDAQLAESMGSAFDVAATWPLASESTLSS